MKKIFCLIALACMVGGAKAQNCPPPPTLVMHWNFDGNFTEQLHGWAGSYLKNSGGAGTPNYVTGSNGAPGTALKISGNYLRIPSDPAMDLQSWTINAVIRIHDMWGGPCQGNAIVWRGQQFGSNHYNLEYFDNAYDHNCVSGPGGYSPGFDVFAGGAAGIPPFAEGDWLNTPPVNNTTDINPFLLYEQWYCVTLMYDAVNGWIDLYVDNKHVINLPWPNQYAPPTVNDLFIGSSDNPSGLYPYFVFADIDDIKIYDGVFTNATSMGDICSTCQPPQLPCVAHWGFDGATPLVDDQQGLIGTIVGPAGSVASAAGVCGVPRTAFRFKGNGYIQVPHDPSLDLQSWTIRAIVQPQGFYAGICQGNIIVSKGTQISGNNYYSLLFTDNAFDNNCALPAGYNPTKDVFIGNPAGTAGLPQNTWLGTAPNINPFIVPGQWYCVTASYDGVTGHSRLWVDGKLAYDEIWPNQYGAMMTPADLFIGGQNNVTFPYFFNGIIDDIALYDGAATCPMSCDNGVNGLPKIGAGVENVITKEGVSIAPNPVTDQLTVTIPADWHSLSINIIDAVGRVVVNEVKGGGGKYEFDLSQLSAGIYMLKVETRDHSVVQKFVKK